jgi:glycine/D-amino acid oxidase-like deaminating enzyme
MANTETTWQKNWHSDIIYPSLKGDVSADVAVVGGGITGITTAYLLAKAGKKVAVLEKGNLHDSSHTAYTTAMITAQVDTSFEDLIKIFGKDKAVQVWHSGMQAIDGIEKIIQDEAIDCEFERTTAFVYANDKDEWKSVKKEGELAKVSGFPVTLVEDGAGLGIPNSGYYELANQAIFHPLKYCEGVRSAAVKAGARFFENTEVVEVEEGKQVILHTEAGEVKAKWLVVATYEPFNKPKELFAKKGLYLTYMYELSIPKNKIKPGLYIDGYTPYHYFRIDEGKMADRMIIGGADHREEIKTDPEKNYAEILEYANKVLGGSEFEVKARWRGGILETLDGLPYIGMYSKKYTNIFAATGFSGNGMTYSSTGAQIIVDKILGKPNVYADIFDPRRRQSFEGLYIKGRDYLVELWNGTIKNAFRK